VGFDYFWGFPHGGGAGSQRVEPDPNKPPGQLFHLDRDLAESSNLYTAHPEKVKALSALLKTIQDSGRRCSG
jgi:hypothetical protein